MKKMNSIFIAFLCLFLLNISLIIAEENTSTSGETQEQPAAPASAQSVVPTESETQWLWGEVISLDTSSRALLVKYLDYDTDQEKEMAINIDEKTTFENVKSLDEIKPKDTVGIDYIISPDSKNIAKNVSVEKMEEEQTTQQQEAVTAPIKPETTVAPAAGVATGATTAPVSVSVPALEKEPEQ